MSSELGNTVMSDQGTEILLARLSSGDHSAVNPLFDLHRDRLKRMVNLRLHPKVRSRADASDIVQDVLIEANHRIDEFVESGRMPFYIWLRWLTHQRIKMCHRHHLDVQKRTAKRDELLFSNGSHALSESIAFELIGKNSTPSQIVQQNELHDKVKTLLDDMKPLDREILCMRHVEQMSNAEVAAALNIESSTASTRYIRALSRLREALGPTAESRKK